MSCFTAAAPTALSMLVTPLTNVQNITFLLLFWKCVTVSLPHALPSFSPPAHLTDAQPRCESMAGRWGHQLSPFPRCVIFYMSVNIMLCHQLVFRSPDAESCHTHTAAACVCVSRECTKLRYATLCYAMLRYATSVCSLAFISEHRSERWLWCWSSFTVSAETSQAQTWLFNSNTF